MDDVRNTAVKIIKYVLSNVDTAPMIKLTR